MYFSFFFEACFRRAAAACKNGILYMQFSRKVLLAEWGLLKYKCSEHHPFIIFALSVAKKGKFQGEHFSLNTGLLIVYLAYSSHHIFLLSACWFY